MHFAWALGKKRISVYLTTCDIDCVDNKSEMHPPKRPSDKKRESFIVQCIGFRCMAYRDRMGKWRDYFNDDEIQGEVKIISPA